MAPGRGLGISIAIPIDDVECAGVARAIAGASLEVEFLVDDPRASTVVASTRRLMTLARAASVRWGELRGRTIEDVAREIRAGDARFERWTRGDRAAVPASTAEQAAIGLALRTLADAIAGAVGDKDAVRTFTRAREVVRAWAWAVSETVRGKGATERGARRDDACEDMFTWAVARGGTFKCAPCACEVGSSVMREVRAVERVEAGECVARVPWDALLGVEQTVETSSPSPTSEILKQLTRMGDQIIMVIWLTAALDALECGDASAYEEWAPALRALPTRASSSLAWNADDLGAVAGEDLANRLREYRSSVKVQYDALFPALCEQVPEAFPARAFGDYAKFERAYDIWTSYAMKVQDPDSLQIREVIVPGVFLCNHSLSAHSVRYTSLERGTKAFRLELSRGCVEGEAITISYGRLDNADLLMFYGFSLENNPYDRVSLHSITGDASETQLEALRHASNACEHDLTRLPVCLARDGSLDRVLAQIRILYAPQQFMLWCELDEYHPFIVVDFELEHEILQRLVERLRAMRDEIHTCDDINTPDLTQVASASYWYRHEQMRIMESAITRMESLLHEYAKRVRKRNRNQH